MQAAWEAHRRLPVQAQAPQLLRHRALKPQEVALVQKASRESTWDEGAIAAFLEDPATQRGAWDCGPHTVLFFGPSQEASRVVAECGKMWDWLGVSRPFRLVLWWRDDPRQIAADEWPSRATVNGGWTHQHGSTIYVYRKEEWDRVFLHEMIHALGWDWQMPNAPLACWGLPTGSNIVHALFEAWTELYAEWLWCIWHNVSWAVQRAWQDEQAQQILARASDEPWNENTSVYAYYILKAALAPHIDQLLLYGNGTAQERETVLCRLVQPSLRTLALKARRVRPRAMSLRMVCKQTTKLNVRVIGP